MFRFVIALIAAVSVVSIADCKKKKSSVKTEVRFVAASDGLRMRSTPTLNGEKITTIGNGAKVKVLEEGDVFEVDGLKSNWYKIEFAGKEGWAFGGYLTRPTMDVESGSEKFMGLWKGKMDCQGKHTHLKVHPDHTFTGWIMSGPAGAACTGEDIQGTWAMADKTMCFMREKAERSCYDQEKGQLMANEEKGASFKENSGKEFLSFLRR
ncbi:MAG: SH3 domain-containing protein [Leptospirales bacterium]|nr:SH3 domain-containing protein [Leptospirales bacterium]